MAVSQSGARAIRPRADWLAPLGAAATLVLAGAAFAWLNSKVAQFFGLQAGLTASALLWRAGLGRSRGWVALGIAGVLASVAVGALWANGFDTALYQIEHLPDSCRRLISL